MFVLQLLCKLTVIPMFKHLLLVILIHSTETSFPPSHFHTVLNNLEGPRHVLWQVLTSATQNLPWRWPQSRSQDKSGHHHLHILAILWRQQNSGLTLPIFFLISISTSCISDAVTGWSAEQQHDRKVDQAPGKFLSRKSSSKGKKELLSSIRKMKLKTKLVLVCICSYLH